jgi:hypothetical protein
LDQKQIVCFDCCSCLKERVNYLQIMQSDHCKKNHRKVIMIFFIFFLNLEHSTIDIL